MTARQKEQRAPLAAQSDHARCDPITEYDYLIPGAIAVVFYLIGLIRLGMPTAMYFDEVYHARTGMQYVLGESPMEWTHPPLTKLLIALSLKLWHVHFDPSEGHWADNTVYPYTASFAWRLPSLIFGAITLVVFYSLVRAIFRRRDMAATATALLALDGAFFVQSRVAMTNIFTVCYVLIAVLGTYRLLTTNNLKHFPLIGLGVGLALANRWTAIYVWGLIGLALVWHLFVVLIPVWRTQWRHADGDTAPPSLFPHLIAWVSYAAISMVLMPVAIYALSYIPNVLQGPGDWHAKLLTWNGLGGEQSWAYNLGIKEGLQHNMWAYHSGMKDKHPYSSPWWSWPAMIRPVWYYDGHEPVTNKPMYIYCIGNMAIWWASVPALIGATYVALRHRRVDLGLVALMGLGQWLMWGIEPRSLVFMHYFFESIPYAVIAITYFAWGLWENVRAWPRWLTLVYGIAAVGWWIYYYPILTAYPVTDQFVQMHWTGTQDWVRH